MASNLNSNSNNLIIIPKSSQKSRKKVRNKQKTELPSPSSPIDQLVGNNLEEYISQCISWARNEDRGLLAAKFRETSEHINFVFACPGLTAQMTGNLVELLTSSVFTKPSKSSKEIFKQIYTTLVHSQLMYPGGPLDNFIEQSFDGNQKCEIRIKHLTNIVHLFEVLINKLPEKIGLIEYIISKLIDKSETCSDTGLLPLELKERLKGLSTILKKVRGVPVDGGSTECKPLQITEFSHSSGAVGKHELRCQTEDVLVPSGNTFVAFESHTLSTNREDTALKSSINNSNQLTKPSKELKTQLILPKEPSSNANTLQSTGFSKLSILPRNSSDIIPKKSKRPIQDVATTPHLYIRYLFEQLREESLFPIRKSLTRYFSRERKSIDRYLYIYENVRCRGLSCSDKEGVVVNISFSPVGVKNPKKYKWISSKRLKFGSVICIFTKSKEKHYFDKIYFATIVRRNAREMSKHLCVSIRFEDGVPIGFDPSLEYTMIESKSSHFKHLHNCLKALISIDIDSIPIQDVLLNQCCHSILPAYIKSGSKSGNNIGEWEVNNRSQYSAIEFALTNHIALFKAPNLVSQYNTSELFIKSFLKNRARVLQSLPTQLAYQFDERIVLQRLAEIRSRIDLKIDIEFYSVLCLSPLLVILPDTQTMDSFLEKIHSTENNFIRLNSRNSTNRQLAAKSLFEVTDRYLNTHDLPQEIRKLKSQIQSLQSKLYSYKKKLWNVSRDILESRALTESNIQQVVSADVYESLFNSNLTKPKHISLIDYWLTDGSTNLINIVSSDAVPIPSEIPEMPISTDYTVKQYTEFIQPIDVTYQVTDSREELIDDFNYGDFDPSLENVGGLEAQYCNYSVDNTEAELAALEQSGDSEYSQSSDSAESESSDLENDFFDEILEESVDRETQGQLPADSVLDTKLNVWEIELSERVKLYKLWGEKFREKLFEDLVSISEDVNKVVTDISSVRSELDTYIMKQVPLIATTPVEGVKFFQQLKQLKPRIVIIHSACYLRESELVALLTNSVTHLILFDQLNSVIPKDSKSSNSNCLIQRLVKNGFKYFPLLPRLVMRPEIAALTESYIDVQVDPNLPNVMGVSKNVFFVDSSSPENCFSRQGTDFTNEQEASFLVQFAKYLLKQGYSEKDISIYTFYPAQKAFIKSLLRKVNIRNGLKLSLVNPSAKRLNRISLVSLVRSNKHNDIGTLTNTEIVYTAFSTASEGLYVVGDAECIRASSDCPVIWEIILDAFKRNLNKKLPLSCQTHGNITLVSRDKDFRKVRNGGCLTPCSVQLSCGHMCPQICHPGPHAGTECVQTCGHVAMGSNRDENCEISSQARNSTLHASSFQDSVLYESQTASW